jgi:Rrf2 family protein
MISTKARYAIKLMIDLVEQTTQQETPCPVKLEDIAARQGISKKYLESIVKMLVAGKLVKGASGKGGGYVLTRKPEDYNVFEVIQLTEGSLSTVSCLEEDAAECPREKACKTVAMWRQYDELVKDYFSKISFVDLANGKL